MFTGKNYIGYSQSADGNDVFESFNPKSQTIGGSFVIATIEEVNKAVALAKNAFPVFSAKSDEERANFLETIADEILALGDDLINTYCFESGLPEGRAMGERGRTMGQLKAFANHIKSDNWRHDFTDEADTSRQPLPKPELFKSALPLGPIAVFGASNFPLAFSTAGGDTASALAAGCPVVVKGHPMHPGTGELVSKAIIKAAKKCDMPEGVFSNLNSNGNEAGQLLVSHPDIKGVGFTGSLKGGKALYDLASKRNEPIPVFAEMGSINPVVLSSTAIEKRGNVIAKQIAGSVTLGAGQFCTNPGLVIVLDNPNLKEFENQLSNELEQIEAQCMLHPNIKNAFNKNRESKLQSEVITALNAIGNEEGNLSSGMVVKVAAKDFVANSELQEEVFGPFTMLVVAKDMEELKKVISSLHGQLTASVLAEPEDFEEYKSIVNALQFKVGRIIFNGMPTGVEVSPAMVHGGPFPATTDSRFTSVGLTAIQRWIRPICFQDMPKDLMP
ncbi:aldehyde dehydrogenase (NADP(+)) [Aegicerativicinus sediminis]|uniref:aldehyde dehydrogenase (NADP(+)) n=1 Tax=Aegicerativicinus sediminis TaxID=2893202 RepID=UPI001E32D16D|nr:aldehyde dehydrogenase (NADP(+)) [Aegicerativicinus sediminis]